MLGDIVGQIGVAAGVSMLPTIRERWQPDMIIANAENAANGSGLNTSQYKELIDAGLDGLTLGDHVFKRSKIAATLEQESNIIRPANLPTGAAGRGWMRINTRAQRPKASLFVTTVLGRVYIDLRADDPFVAVERVLSQLPEASPLVIVEVHAEATAEKAALAHFLEGKVAAVIGTHTHVPTADARILPAGTAFISDIGMSGPHHSIIGRQIDRVVKFMTTAMPSPFDVAEKDVRVCGVFIQIDESTRRATKIERIELPFES